MFSMLCSLVLALAPGDGAAPQTKTLLVFGGTNFIGPNLVPAAQKAGFKVTLFNRGKTNPQLFPDVEKLMGDRDPKVGDGLKALEGRKFDAIIDDSGHVPRHVRAAAQMLAKDSGFYVYVSSLSAYAGHETKDADESAPLAPLVEETEDYKGVAFGPLKALCEKEVQDAFKERCAIVRPGLIVGPGDKSDRFTYWIDRMTRGGDVLAPGAKDDPIRLIDVRDLAEWLVRLADQKTAGVFNAIGPEVPLTMEHVLDACKEAANREVTIHWADESFLDANDVHGWTDLPVWLPPSGGTAGFHTRSIAAALKAGLTFRPIDDTAKATHDWWMTLPEERRKTLKNGLKPEREKELIGKLQLPAK